MDKTKKQLEQELETLRDRIKLLEASENQLQQTKQILETSEQKYRTMFENTGTPTILIEENKIVSMVNSEFERISGFSREEVEGKMLWTEFVSQEHIKMMVDYHDKRRIDPASAPRTYSCKLVIRSGEIKTAILTVAMIPGTKQSLVAVLDVTDKRRLSEEILEISERERRKIGRDLHDDLGQHLIGIEALSSLLERRLKTQSNRETRLAGEISELIKEATRKTKSLAKGLCPIDIEGGGLIASLKEFAELTQKVFGISCVFEYDKHIIIDDDTTAMHLYRIVQEATNNAVRHGRSDKVIISLTSEEDSIVLSIEDNGIGIPKNPDRRNSLGLNIMEYRATSIEATFQIQGRMTGGTEVICTLNRKF